MTPIKIEITVDQSNVLAVTNFLNSIAGGTVVTEKAEEVKTEAPRKEPAKRAAKVKAPEPEPEVEEEEAMDLDEEEASAITADDIRLVQATKVTANREAIVKKLKSLGATGIKDLKEENFQEYHEFLSNLK